MGSSLSEVQLLEITKVQILKVIHNWNPRGYEGNRSYWKSQRYKF